MLTEGDEDYWFECVCEENEREEREKVSWGNLENDKVFFIANINA